MNWWINYLFITYKKLLLHCHCLMTFNYNKYFTRCTYSITAALELVAFTLSCNQVNKLYSLNYAISYTFLIQSTAIFQLEKEDVSKNCFIDYMIYDFPGQVNGFYNLPSVL